jgi:hypothetical protein
MHTPPLMMLPAGRNRATSPSSARPRLVRARGLATNIELVRATPTIVPASAIGRNRRRGRDQALHILLLSGELPRAHRAKPEGHRAGGQLSAPRKGATNSPLCTERSIRRWWFQP